MTHVKEILIKFLCLGHLLQHKPSLSCTVYNTLGLLLFIAQDVRTNEMKVTQQYACGENSRACSVDIHRPYTYFTRGILYLDFEKDLKFVLINILLFKTLNVHIYTANI